MIYQARLQSIAAYYNYMDITMYYDIPILGQYLGAKIITIQFLNITENDKKKLH